MKGKHNQGFSLVEVLVSMTILAAIVLPVCTCITLCARIDAKADAVLRARLAVSSAVEQLKEEGIVSGKITTETDTNENGEERLATVYSFDELPVRIVIDSRFPDGAGAEIRYYNVSVSDRNALVTVKTSIPAAPPAPPVNSQEGPTE